MKYKKIALSKISTLLFGLLLLSSLSLNVKSDSAILDLKIVGATSRGIFIPGPCPPGVQCTYDSQGASGIVFRITYQGKNQCNVSDILIWHETYGFNFTGPLNISPPPFLLLSATSYEFIVNKSFVYGIPIEFRVQTLQQGEFFYSLTADSSISQITDWNPVYPTSENTGITFFPIAVGICLTVIFLRRWKNEK